MLLNLKKTPKKPLTQKKTQPEDDLPETVTPPTDTLSAVDKKQKQILVCVNLN